MSKPEWIHLFISLKVILWLLFWVFCHPNGPRAPWLRAVHYISIQYTWRTKGDVSQSGILCHAKTCTIVIFGWTVPLTHKTCLLCSSTCWPTNKTLFGFHWDSWKLLKFCLTVKSYFDILFILLTFHHVKWTCRPTTR